MSPRVQEWRQSMCEISTELQQCHSMKKFIEVEFLLSSRCFFFGHVMQAHLRDFIVCYGDIHLPLCRDGCLGHREMETCQRQVSIQLDFRLLLAVLYYVKGVSLTPSVHFQSSKIDQAELDTTGTSPYREGSLRVSIIVLVELDEEVQVRPDQLKATGRIDLSLLSSAHSLQWLHWAVIFIFRMKFLFAGHNLVGWPHAWSCFHGACL